jgi:hypothetical protein
MEKFIENLKIGDCVSLYEKGKVIKLKVEAKTEPTKPNIENKPKT